MRIQNCGKGIHSREVSGIEKLKSLPINWYAYSNLDLSIASGTSREIDVILIADDRILLIDLKDWRGPIESRGGNWFNNGRDHGPSPVAKMSQNVRSVYLLLKEHLNKHSKVKGSPIPKVQGLIVVTSQADISGIAETEIANVKKFDDFLTTISSVPERVACFGAVPPIFVQNPLTTPEWKDQLAKFFNVSRGVFKPGRRDYGGFFASSDEAVFIQAKQIYAEYNVSDERAAPNLGTLRLWDFTKAEPRFQTEAGRLEIVGREQQVVTYLQDRSDRCNSVLLSTRVRDQLESVAYWEVFERKRRLIRLSDLATSEGSIMSREDRIELARQTLSAVDALHVAEATHLDLGAHSIWLQSPSTAKLSHLMAASYSQVESLGEKRYQFLSSSILPEDILEERVDAKRKDVYLVAIAVHRIFFGKGPKLAGSGQPPEWDAGIDPDGTFENLHNWFTKALSWDAHSRFADAGAALTSFNEAMATKPTPREVLEGLATFQNSIRTQLQLYRTFAVVEDICDDERLAMWHANRSGSDTLVKVWKRASWGDSVREGPRILDFLNQLRGLSLDPPVGCAKILDAFWLGDAIVMTQEWINKPTLSQTLKVMQNDWREDDRALVFCRALVNIVQQLHERRIAHGDLKPSNILVDPEVPNEPILIDLVDFASMNDGEIFSSAYAPPDGGRFERDCFGATRVVEEVLALASLDPAHAVRLAESISVIRTVEPINSTLLPLLTALEWVEEPSEILGETIAIASTQMVVGPIFPDEGSYFIRQMMGRSGLILRGACEELEVEFDVNGSPFRARRREVNQRQIPRLEKYEFTSVKGLINVIDGTRTDLRALFETLSEAKKIWKDQQSERQGHEAVKETSTIVEEDEMSPPEAAEDKLEEEIASEVPLAGKVDIRALWEKLIEVEREQKTEGVVINDSTYIRDARRHLVQFELETGTFEYRRGDRVLIERLDRHGNWWRLGDLDIEKSRPNLLVIDAARFSNNSADAICVESQRLRFRSSDEETSLQRRDAAVFRITNGQSRIRDLIKVFDPRADYRPSAISAKIQPDEFKKKYNLNDDQAKALSGILVTRPLGLVQGPPGTGKTVFIAALIHQALTSGAAKNVLLASQSHEAVNNAAEAVLKLFGYSGDAPSILRVGHEASVSDRLLPFHSVKVERLYKDRFQATLRERLHNASKALGIEKELAEQLIFIETAIRPVVVRLIDISATEDVQTERSRADGLLQTLAQQLKNLSLGWEDFDDVNPEELVSEIVKSCIDRIDYNERPSLDKVARFRSAALLAQDFINSVSTERRSFETFLAGTRQIVAGTCVGLGRSSLGLTTTPFDLVVVDEAARCTASELAVPIQAGGWIVLVGDQAQLEPQHDPDIVGEVAASLRVSKGEVMRSDFERVFQTEYGKTVGHGLRKQYRMLPPIGNVVSSSFYNPPLTHGRLSPIVPEDALPPDLSNPLLWVETDAFGESAQQSCSEHSRSLVNVLEADCIVELMKRWAECLPFMEWLGKPNQHAQQIGIICGYAAQRDLIRRKFQQAALNPNLVAALKIDTIDSYQGKENPIVVLSLVRNNMDGPLHSGVATIRPGFMARPNRINVAMSRAMDRLIIVGSRRRWEAGGPMSRVSDAFFEEEVNGTASRMDAVSLLRRGGSSQNVPNQLEKA